MERLMETVSYEQWHQFLKDWHTLVALFYTEGEVASIKMLQQLESEFEPALKDFPDTIAVKLRVQENAELVKRLDIRGTPTLMLFHRGEAVKRIFKNPVPGHHRVDRIVTPYRGMAKDLLDLVANLHRIAKK